MGHRDRAVTQTNELRHRLIVALGLSPGVVYSDDALVGHAEKLARAYVADADEIAKLCSGLTEALDLYVHAVDAEATTHEPSAEFDEDVVRLRRLAGKRLHAKAVPLAERVLAVVRDRLAPAWRAGGMDVTSTVVDIAGDLVDMVGGRRP